MVCVPCIFVGLAIVIWCKYVEPYVKPIYERVCRSYPQFRVVGNQLALLLGFIERCAEKLGLRMPQSCPMPKKSNRNGTPKVTEELHSSAPTVHSE